MEIGTKTPWECQLCFESYDETDRRPRALPCGHPFCSPCITNMIKNDQLTCPYCRATHRATSYTDFPISYGMEEFIRSLKSPSIATKPVQDPSGVIGKNLQALMLEHENDMKKSRELICQNLLKQMDLYDAELVNSQKDHEQLVTRLNSLVEQNKFATQLLQRQRNIIQIKKTAFENLKKKQSTIQTCMSSASTTQEALSAVEDQLGCSTEMKNWIRNCQEDFPDVEAIHISMKVREVTRMTLDNVIIKDNSMVAIPTHLITLIRTQEKSSTIMDRVKLITFSVNDLQQKGEFVKSLLEAGRVVAVKQDNGILHCSRITLRSEMLHLHTLLKKPKPGNACTLEYSSVVNLLNSSSTRVNLLNSSSTRVNPLNSSSTRVNLLNSSSTRINPLNYSTRVNPLNYSSTRVNLLNSSSTLVFLDLGWRGSTQGRIYIQLSPDTEMAKQFMWLCTGQKGPSYLNSCIFSRDFVWGSTRWYISGGDYEKNNGKGGAPLLSGMHYRNEYNRTGKGLVTYKDDPWSPTSAQFCIYWDESKSERAFGQVVQGLEVVQSAAYFIREAKVVDCGVVLPS